MIPPTPRPPTPPSAPGAPDDPLVLTVLQAPPGAPQQKVVRAEGAASGRPPLVWAAHLVRCANIDALGALLAALEGESSCVLIRGCPRRGAGVTHEALDSLRAALAERQGSWAAARPLAAALARARRALRALAASPGAAGAALEEEEARLLAALEGLGWQARRKTSFEEVPRRWVWLDLDSGLDLPHAVDLSSPAEHLAALRWVVREALPAHFHGVSFVGQWSSSAFLRGREVKAHMAFLLDHPLGDAQWRRWSSSWPRRWDPATFGTVQPHFTCAPRFEGLADPLAARLFVVREGRAEVRVGRLESFPESFPESCTLSAKPAPAPTIAPEPRAPRDSLESLEAREARAPRALAPAPADAVARRGVEGGGGTEAGRRALAQHAGLLAHTAEGDRNRRLYLAACALGRLEGGGQVSEPEVREALLAAAGRCGLLGEVGAAECARQIGNGLRWGRARPLAPDEEGPAPLSLHAPDYRARLARALNDAIFAAQRAPARVPVLALTCGGGKTTALCEQVARDVAGGRTRVVLCRNHEMAEAVAAEVARVAAEEGLRLKGRVRVLGGIQRHCALLAAAVGEERERLARLAALGRRALCGVGAPSAAGRCPHAATCEGARRPEALPRGLTIATHAMGPLLEIPEGAVVLIDELPTPVRAHALTAADLAPLAGGAPPLAGPLAAWAAARPALRPFAAAVLAALRRLEEEGAAAPAAPLAPLHSDALTPAQALALLDGARPLAAAALAHDLSAPPAHATRGEGGAPASALVSGLAALAEGLARGAWPGAAQVCWRRGRAWLEVRERYALPRAPLVALDGTAQRSARVWGALAAAAGCAAEVRPIAVVGEAPLFARWVPTQQLRSSQLIERREGGAWQVEWRPRASASLRRAAFTLAEAARDAGLAPGRPVGVLAAKHVADALRLSCEQPCDPAFDPAAPRAREVIEALREATAHLTLTVGHLGAHDVGSNIYHGVELFALLGSSKPDWGATLADLSALDVPAEELPAVYAQLTAARDVQALARARHLRRPGVALLYIGDMDPPTGHDLPDVRWELTEAAHPRASGDQLDLEDLAAERLLRVGYLCPPDLEARFGLKRAKARALCERLQRRFDLITWPIRPPAGRGRDTTAYGLAAAAPRPRR